MAAESKSNVKKRKKTTFADNLDNNASVKQIVEFLHAKCRTKKVFSYYTQLLQRNCAYYMHFVYPGHPLSAFNDDWDGALNSGYFKTFTHKSLKPKMITPKIQYMSKPDPVTDIMSKKNEWLRCWDGYRSQMCLLGKKAKVYEWLNEEMIHCMNDFVKIAEHNENDPDIYFDSCYNWYYAGNGNMHLMCVNGEDYLLHSELGCIYLSPFSKDSLTIDYDNEVKYDCGKDTYILETTSSQNIIAIRTKHKVTILKLVESTVGLCIEKLKDMESKLPFTGISFDEYHKNILYVTTLDYKLTIVNIDRMAGRSKQLKGKVETLVDNWSTVIGSERAYFTHVTKTSLTLYDKRTNNAFERWKNVSNIVDGPRCSNITVAKYRPSQPFVYIGTDHHMFLIDMRYNKDENKTLKPVQRWTHGMECIPTYMSMCDFEHGKELMCLSSQWCEDMCVFSVGSDKLTKQVDLSSVTIPYRPPSVFATLLEAKQKMMCCDIHNPIQDRLCTAVTGQIVIEHGDGYCVLMQNSLGDISSHVLLSENMMMFVDDDSVEQLDEWSKSYKRERKDFEVSYIENIQNVWKSLKKVPNTYKFGESKYARKGRKFNEQEIYDAFENEELDSGLLDVWMRDTNDETIEPRNQTVRDSD